ncbi:hypothetical protein [Streptomyces beijiangensis]|uniref:D-alanyl-D-alanine carboxypeptidase n=1 Tax=Streptomyces beijiangensis TaxID=163361 RepID=A0A939JK59_9ACTN|nr:hypothetical protein [Streptomyces beijiangensis]MBO0514955.1 hypothetical protein [Streptomyces beijiangensis]
MSVILSDQDKLTLRTAAYGAVTLLATADAGGSPGKVAAQGSIALNAATGLVGHVLAEKASAGHLTGKSTAELADQVLPALTDAVQLLKKQAPDEAANFRSTVLAALETGLQARKNTPGPTLTTIVDKITQALDAA